MIALPFWPAKRVHRSKPVRCRKRKARAKAKRKIQRASRRRNR